jgi:DNA replication and repair protein RecF
MRFKDLQLHNFRNHNSTKIECAEDRNLFLGNNGEGKTNLLEAISYLCLTKSFYAATDATAVQIGQSSFTVTGDAVSDIDVAYEIKVSYAADTREKEISINKGLVSNKSSVIGMFPVVVLSQENGALTSGAPADRRKFVDIVVSQSSKSYLEDLIEYRRVLRQRNRILLDAKLTQRYSPDLLEPWNEPLIKRGAQISHRRGQFVQEFVPYLIDAFERIAGAGEHPSIAYGPGIGATAPTPEETERLFRSELLRQQGEERKVGMSLVGPHKDELIFEINELGLKSFASQGQHKTFLVALKVAEFFYLRERCSETPILLLDDVFGELDDLRSAKLLGLTEELGQTFITATDGRRFGSTDKGRRTARFYITQGQVSYAAPSVVAQ